ncbi:DUF1080 domain-containing protein [Opitutales bacterium]|nr:DUF1080 domain-containing protein [Opitutales bacterium]MDA9119987.1 DUF1080 domain-containing protein [Opitutales bacterium]MDB3958498.1 DUF1080 domain-containing protein [Opitutales bacterium]MDC0363261.1 DUF1080 domain-containing protein [Opitutales bacterium]
MKYILINLSFIWATALFAESGKSTNLLNAKSLQLNKHWEIAEGVLTTSKTPGGILWTKGKFGDFEVTLEYKTSEKANSGLFFRTDPRNPVQGGFEIQIASPGLYSGKHVLGSLYDAKEAAVSAGKPDGEWNMMTLTCKGPSIKATVNGQTTVDVNIDQWTERKKNPDGTKNKFKTPLKDMPRVGHLGLQYHGQPVWFRKFEIKPLN